LRVHLTALQALKCGGVALVVLALFSMFWLAAGSDSALARLRVRYVTYLDQSLRLLFLGGSGRLILRCQVAAVAGIVGFVGLFGPIVPYWYAGIALAVFAPIAFIANERRKRVKTLEVQVDGFILALSNALRTVPSPTAALQSIVAFVPNPTRQELERVVKEMRVGNTLEQSLVNMSSRIGSRPLDAALSSVLVGLQVGGNLPIVLETTAGTIRDMRRLEGVVQSKTGEARAQLWVLAAFPFFICAGFNSVSPGYFEPLQHTATGLAVVSLAVSLWVGSLLIARKVLAVDI
jgi:tight adherence protein B